MNQGGNRNTGAGFTIVEVMIVLAVSSIMLVSAMLLINGRQGKAAFFTAINGVQQQLQQIINETATGYYPNNNDFSCSVTAGTITFTATPNGQGANGGDGATSTGCLFLGKAVQFGLDTNTSQLGVLPIVGSQYFNGNSVQFVPDAKPRAVYPSAATETTVPKTATSLVGLESLTVAAKNNTGCSTVNYGVCYIDATTSTAVKTGAIAFIAGDSGGQIANPDKVSLKSGALLMSLYAVSGSPQMSAVNQSLTATSLAIGNNPTNSSSELVHASSVSICLASASSSQSGLLTIDAGLQVSLRIMTGLTC